MITTASFGPTMGAHRTNCMEETAWAARPASWNIPAPSAAACWLVPVPTTQIRRARCSPSVASWTCAVVWAEPSMRSSSSGCERI